MNDQYLEATIATLQSFCPNQKTITPDMKIVEDLGLESIDFVDFIFELEKVVNLRIDIVQLSVALSQGTTKRFREVKISDIANYIRTLRNNI